MSSQAPSTKLTCQICSKIGHSAKLCYRRYDKDPNWIPNPRRSSNSSAQAFAAQTDRHIPQSTQWILDSGANHHVTNDLNNLSLFFSYDGGDKLHVGNGTGLGITHIGSTSFLISNQAISLCDVLHVPNFSTNLLSISKLLIDNPNLSINFFSSYCVFKDRLTNSILLQVPSCNGLFSLPMNSSFQALLGTRTSTNTWHARLGHPSHSTTLHLIDSFSLPCNSNKFDMCHDCALAKAHQLPYDPSSFSSNSPLHLVHSDVWGPSPIISSLGYRYYIIFVDDFTRYTWIYFLKQKSEVPQIFSKFKAQIENLLGTSIKILRTDGGTEYKPISSQFPQILHQTSCPYTPQQNGVAERKHRHIIELSLATMSHSSIPSLYWDEIFSSIVYLINRLPSNKFIPFSSLFNQQPDYNFLRVLGCQCFPFTRPYNKNKLELRSTSCVFIGYAHLQKGYRCLNLETQRVFISRDVQFNENVFPFKAQAATTSAISSSPQQSSLLVLQHVPPTLLPQPTQLAPAQGELSPLTHTERPASAQAELSPLFHPNSSASAQVGSSPSPHEDRPASAQADISPLTHTKQSASAHSKHLTSAQQAHPVSGPPGTSFSPQAPITEACTGNPTSALIPLDSSTPLPLPRDTINPSDPLPFSQTSPATLLPIHSMITRSKDNSRKPKVLTDYVAHMVTLESEPLSFSQANSSETWRTAMAMEIDALARNNTWTLVSPPPDHTIIGCRWVYKIKRKPDGSIERYKARLVAKGYHQQDGVDFSDTYSPVV